MAPSAIKCGVYDKSIHGKQKRLNCRNCNKLFHTACIRVSEDDLEFLLVNGESITILVRASPRTILLRFRQQKPHRLLLV